MRDWTTIRNRYLRDGLPTRLGGLAANLGRIRSFALRNASPGVVESLIDESKRFIEWTAAEADVNVAAELVELQVELAGWQRSLPQIVDDPALRGRLAKRAESWSERVLEMSGLLG